MLSHTILTVDDPHEKGLGKHCNKRRQCCLKDVPFNLQYFLDYQKQKSPFLINLIWHFKGGYLDFSHLIELRDIYITESYMKNNTNH